MVNAGGEAAIVLGAMERRRSIRSYRREQVPAGDILAIVSAGRLAPSSGNGQPWRFLVVEDKAAMRDLLEKSAEALCEAAGDAAAKARIMEWSARYEDAAALVLLLEDLESPYPAYAGHDCPLAAANIMLMATAMGYGSTYLTDTVCPEGARRALALPPRYEPRCAIAIGVPAEIPEAHDRKPLREIVWRGEVGRPFEA